MSAAPGEEPSPPRRGRDLRLVVSGIAAALLVWFAVANLQDVRIHFWVATTTAPLIEVVIVAGVLGAAVASVVRRRRRASPPHRA